MIDVFKENLEQILLKKDLSYENASYVMKEIMNGKLPASRIAALLIGLRMKGESIDEISAFASVMREFALKIETEIPYLVDTCGTGGDTFKTFNISTISALVAASCGVPIAKHGNRAVSSKCGSADLLESLGVNLNVKEDIVKQCIESANFGFLFAPAFHPAMKYAMPTRKELGIRTIFNILGPLTNPAFAKGQILGVFSKELVEPMALVLAKLGISKGFVFHSEPGIDEIVPLGNVYIAEIKENIVNFSIKSPEEFGFPKINVEDIKSGDLEQNTRIAVNILSGKDTSIRRDIIILNTAYAILTSGIESDMDKAKEMAKNAIEKGLPIQILKDLIRITKGDITKLENLLK